MSQSAIKLKMCIERFLNLTHKCFLCYNYIIGKIG